MQVDSRHITIDAKDNTFTGYGTNIVCNIIAYSSLDEEDDKVKKMKVEEERKDKERRKEQEFKKIENEKRKEE